MWARIAESSVVEIIADWLNINELCSMRVLGAIAPRVRQAVLTSLFAQLNARCSSGCAEGRRILVWGAQNRNLERQIQAALHNHILEVAGVPEDSTNVWFLRSNGATLDKWEGHAQVVYDFVFNTQHGAEIALQNGETFDLLLPKSTVKLHMRRYPPLGWDVHWSNKHQAPRYWHCGTFGRSKSFLKCPLGEDLHRISGTLELSDLDGLDKSSPRSGLPLFWEERFSNSHQQPYYVHTKSSKTMWERPHRYSEAILSSRKGINERLRAEEAMYVIADYAPTLVISLLRSLVRDSERRVADRAKWFLGGQKMLELIAMEPL